MLKAVLVVAMVLLHAATFVHTQQQINDSLMTGQSLAYGQTLVSAKGTFALGFFSNGDNAYLGIWYKDMKPLTIVWVANRQNPIKGVNGSLTLTTNSLELLDRKGISVWSSGTLAINSPQALLLDSGELVLKDTMSGTFQWHSFDNPSGTLLSGMRIGYDIPAGVFTKLTSWSSKSDPSPGSYSLQVDENRLPDLLLYRDSELTYRTGTWNGQGFTGLPALKRTNELDFSMDVVPGIRAYYTVTSLNSSVLWYLYISPEDGCAYRYRSNSSNEWVEYWKWPHDQCDNYAFCGANAVCSNGNCECLKEFVPMSLGDWSQRIYTDGCVRDVAFSCSPGNGFQWLSHVKVPDTFNATKVQSKSLDECKDLCLRNCSCSAYATLGPDCVIWLGDLVDIVQLIDGISDLYTRISHSDPSPRKVLKYAKGFQPDPRRPILSVQDCQNTAIIVSVSVVGALVVISALLGYFYRQSQRKHLSLPHEHEHERGTGSKLVARLEANLSLRDIKVATNDFAEQNIVVSAQSRTIYKGTLPKFGDLAVKRLTMEVGVEELKNEVSMLTRLDHPNIIRMLGSCIQSNEKVICYEYMPRGSLDTVLFDEDERSVAPDWSSRFRIMQGICEGLLYLHEHCKIIHRDIDPSNILLSESFIPKISDFGLATLLVEGQSEGKSENFRGTRGYSAPELFYGKYSVKSDVYSFGVVLLEILTGRKATSFRKEDTDDLPRYGGSTKLDSRNSQSVEGSKNGGCSSRGGRKMHPYRGALRSG
ncbi:hypothetical protein ACP4OV_008598 [Aristida adscensionis]